ncbi:MAG: hypothetical protein H0W75_12640 [Chitinophagaceae bacterium]|jgi:hypothetical protein|nr:hypothetical protein [Chitinophagaceae bacterium]
MKLILAIIAGIALILIVFFVFNKPAEKEIKQGTTFYFYPKSNVYYDLDNAQFYILSANEGWQATSQILEEQNAALGEKVILDKPDLPVWKANEQHKMIYAASLYTSKQEYQKKFYEDSINSLPKKTVVAIKDTTSTQEENVKKTKTGVGKFLEKIFSGKRDKKKEKEDSLQ